MTDFKNFMNDFSHLMSGMTSVAGGLKTEFEQNLHNLFADFATKSGFVKSDEFNTLYERFEQLLIKVNHLENEIEQLKNVSKESINI